MELRVDGVPFAKTPPGTLNFDNAYALVRAAAAGAGIAKMSAYMASDAISSGLLEVVLGEYASPRPTVWLVYVERRHLSPRVLALSKFLAQHIPPLLSLDRIPA